MRELSDAALQRREAGKITTPAIPHLVHRGLLAALLVHDEEIALHHGKHGRALVRGGGTPVHGVKICVEDAIPQRGVQVGGVRVHVTHYLVHVSELNAASWLKVQSPPHMSITVGRCSDPDVR